MITEKEIGVTIYKSLEEANPAQSANVAKELFKLIQSEILRGKIGLLKEMREKPCFGYPQERECDFKISDLENELKELE